MPDHVDPASLAQEATGNAADGGNADNADNAVPLPTDNPFSSMEKAVTSQEVTAGARRSKRLPVIVLWLVAIIVIVVDQASKQWALSALSDGRHTALFGRALGLVLVRNPGAAFSFATGQTWVFALIALVLVFILNMLNVKMFGEAEFWFALIKVAAIVSFMVVAIVAIVLGLHTGTDPHGGAITAGAHNILGNGGFFPEGFPIVFALTLGVVFAFGGTEMVGVAAGEAKDAEKSLPKAINSMILRIFVFYVGSVMLLALVLPYTSYSKTESPFVTFFSGIGVPYAGDIIQVVVLTAALSSLNAGLYATGRTLRSMAVAGEAPRVAAGLNKHQVPAGGIIITSALGLLGVVLNAYLPGDAFDIVMNLAGIGIAGTWGAILVTHLAFLRRVQEGKEVRPAYRMPWAPWSNYAALAFFTIVVVSNVADPAGRWTLALFAIVAVMMVAGWYAVRGRIRGDLLDEVLADEVDEAASAPSHEAQLARG